MAENTIKARLKLKTDSLDNLRETSNTYKLGEPLYASNTRTLLFGTTNNSNVATTITNTGYFHYFPANFFDADTVKAHNNWVRLFTVESPWIGVRVILTHSYTNSPPDITEYVISNFFQQTSYPVRSVASDHTNSVSMILDARLVHMNNTTSVVSHFEIKINDTRLTNSISLYIIPYNNATLAPKITVYNNTAVYGDTTNSHKVAYQRGSSIYTNAASILKEDDNHIPALGERFFDYTRSLSYYGDASNTVATLLGKNNLVNTSQISKRITRVVEKPNNNGYYCFLKMFDVTTWVNSTSQVPYADCARFLGIVYRMRDVSHDSQSDISLISMSVSYIGTATPRLTTTNYTIRPIILHDKVDDKYYLGLECSLSAATLILEGYYRHTLLAESWIEGNTAQLIPTRYGDDYEIYMDAQVTPMNTSVTKLNSARTLWGQSFDGTNNVTGSIELATRENGQGTSFSYYTPTYVTWRNYMSNSNTGQSVTGGNPSTLGNVVSWGIRSLIENNTNYGWIWESCANTKNANPVARMALSSNNGQLTLTGNIIPTGTINLGGSSNYWNNLYINNLYGCFVSDIHNATSETKTANAKQIWEECSKRNVAFVAVEDYDE